MYELEEYQRKGRNFIVNNPTSLITLDMGLGKTLITLDALEILKEFGYISKILLISFPNILHSWENEINKFDINLNMQIIEGTPKNRLKQLDNTDNVDIVAISIYNLKWFVELNKNNFDCLIIDESSAFKNVNTVRFKSIKRLLKINQFNYKVLLSGTPITRNYADLWSQMFILDSGERLEPYITKFREKYMKQVPYLKNVYKPIDGMEKTIMDKVKDISFNVNVKSIHKINYRYLKHSLPKRALNIINDMKKDFIINTSDNLTEANLINSASVLYNKLIQISSGFIKIENIIENIHTARLTLLKEVLDSYGNENFIIVYSYIAQRDIIINNIKNITLWNKSNGKELINDWNNKKIKYLLVHPNNISHGVNMQEGGNNIIYFSPLNNLESYLQLNKRLARGKEKKIVNIFHLYSSDDDKKIYKALENKNFNLDKFLKAFVK